MEDAIILKGNKDGLNVVINNNSFNDFDQLASALIEKLSKGSKFYRGAEIKIITDLKQLNERDRDKLKDILFDEFMIKECVYEDISSNEEKVFKGIYEGKTKFYRKTIRSGQIVDYPGNIVIIGDVNSGAEVYAGGNVIVFGALKGNVYAGRGGNNEAVIAAITLKPQILSIGEIATRSPDEDDTPHYPEIAIIKDGNIIVEPYKNMKMY